MEPWLSSQSRLLALVILCTVLWSLESAIPLYKYKKHRLRRAVPNLTLTVLLVLMNLVLSFASANVAGFSENRGMGLFLLLKLPSWSTAVLGILALDCFAYFAHLLLHKSWVGWQFHRVHHSEREVNVTTAFRQHPGETLWRILWQVLAVAIFGLPFWVIVVYLVISALNAQFEHANIRVNESLDRLLRLIVVTPNMHKVHHSRAQQQTDTNYSNIFSIWDRVCGTYTPIIDFGQLRYGLDGFDDSNKQTLPALLKMPFTMDP